MGKRIKKEVRIDTIKRRFHFQIDEVNKQLAAEDNPEKKAELLGKIKSLVDGMDSEIRRMS